MSKFTTLDSVIHAKIKIKPVFGKEYGDCINQSLVFPTEFQDLQREYPIFFRQSSKDKFHAVVILGLDKDENLYLKSDKWEAKYIPAMQQRGPFALEQAVDNNEPLIKLNLNDSRAGEVEGESIFLPHGGYSVFFKETLKALQRIHVGAAIADDFFMHLKAFNLLEPVTVQAALSETQSYTLSDLYTISRTRMAELSGDELYKLNQLGLLEHCFSVLSSTGNMSKIVEMKISKVNQLGY